MKSRGLGLEGDWSWSDSPVVLAWKVTLPSLEGHWSWSDSLVVLAWKVILPCLVGRWSWSDSPVVQAWKLRGRGFAGRGWSKRPSIAPDATAASHGDPFPILRPQNVS